MNIGKLILYITGGKPIARKVLAQALGNAIGVVAGWLIARQGIHMSVVASQETAAATSLIAGFAAGYIAREEAKASSANKT